MIKSGEAKQLELLLQAIRKELVLACRASSDADAITRVACDRVADYLHQARHTQWLRRSRVHSVGFVCDRRWWMWIRKPFHGWWPLPIRGVMRLDLNLSSGAEVLVQIEVLGCTARDVRITAEYDGS